MVTSNISEYRLSYKERVLGDLLLSLLACFFFFFFLQVCLLFTAQTLFNADV